MPATHTTIHTKHRKWRTFDTNLRLPLNSTSSAPSSPTCATNYTTELSCKKSTQSTSNEIETHHLATEGLELAVVLRVLSAHRVGHGSREAEGRRHGLGVLAEDEPEVDVEHLTGRVELQR